MAVNGSQLADQQPFQVLGPIRNVKLIAKGSGIRDLARLRRIYGPGRWRKLKGIASIQLSSGSIRLAELHWYQAHGIGKKEIKRKRYLPSSAHR